MISLGHTSFVGSSPSHGPSKAVVSVSWVETWGSKSRLYLKYGFTAVLSEGRICTCVVVVVVTGARAKTLQRFTRAGALQETHARG